MSKLKLIVKNIDDISERVLKIDYSFTEAFKLLIDESSGTLTFKCQDQSYKTIKLSKLELVDYWDYWNFSLDVQKAFEEGFKQKTISKCFV